MSKLVVSRRDFAAGMAAVFATIGDTRAQSSAPSPLSEVTFVATPAAPVCTIAVAIEEGMLSRSGIAGKLTLLPLMPSVPAAIISESAQVGFITTPTFLQAVDGGLDLVAICGGQVTNNKIDDGAVITRTDIVIAKPADFVGKTVGVPGIGAFFHVIFRYWLIERGVDPAKVKYLEVPFPGMGDALRGKSVDAVVAIEPFYSSVVESGTGKVAVRLLTEIPSGKPEVLFVTSRAWAGAHRKEVASLRLALGEAEQAVNKDRDLGIRDLVKYVKLPPAVLPHVSLGTYDPVIDAAGLGWWTEVMAHQEMLSTKIDLSSLIWS